MAVLFTDEQKAILAIAQANIPYTLEPYSDMARLCGVSEDEVLHVLRSMKRSGAIRRFGATIRHQRAGWGANAMVGWLASEEEAELCGPIAASNANISHVYYRPSPVADWPYTLYTMIHGRNDEECLDAIQWLLNNWPLRDYAILRTKRELKKISMTYFP